MLNFSNWFINEMPIQLKLLGNWEEDPKQYRWDKPSIKLLTNPIAVQKINQKWSRLPQQFNAWMLKGPGASQYVERGEVDEYFLKNQLKLKIVQNPQKPDEISIDPNAINVIYTQNIGNDKIPMTAWIIAHRLGHVIKKNNAYQNFLNELEKDVKILMQNVFNKQPLKGNYDYYTLKGHKLLTQFVNALGTMNSAKKGQLRNFFEFPYELLAQYILTGKITFNKLPFKILDRYLWGRPEYIRPYYSLNQEDFNKWNEFITSMEEKYQNLLEHVLESSVGKIYVM